MRAYPRRLLIAVFGLALSSLAALGQTKNPGIVSSIDRFSGPLVPTGKTVAKTFANVPSIHYQLLSLAPGARAAPAPSADTKLMALPLKARGGYTLYELRAGKLFTIINGNRQERTEGEFWLVRPDDQIALEAEDDAVLLQTVQIPAQ